MPFSPSRKVTALSVEAVFMNAGSSVTRPVFARKLETSIPFSPSVPSTTCNSISCLPVTMRTVSGTASPSLCSPARRSLARCGKRVKSAAGRAVRRLQTAYRRDNRRWRAPHAAETPRDRADANARRLGGDQVDRAVAHQQRILRAGAEGSADAQKAVRGGFSCRFISADHRPECSLDPQTPQDLARKGARLVRQHPARLGRDPQQRGDSAVEPRLRQQALCVLLAPDRGGLRVPRLVRRAQRPADQPFRALADETMDHPRLAFRWGKTRQHRVDAVRQVVAGIDESTVEVIDDAVQRHPCSLTRFAARVSCCRTLSGGNQDEGLPYLFSACRGGSRRLWQRCWSWYRHYPGLSRRGPHVRQARHLPERRRFPTGKRRQRLVRNRTGVDHA